MQVYRQKIEKIKKYYYYKGKIYKGGLSKINGRKAILRVGYGCKKEASALVASLPWIGIIALPNFKGLYKGKKIYKSMGKYESGTDKHSYSIRDNLLVCIANELAEANRLKRLELRAMMAYNKDVYNPAIKNEELEDNV